MLPIQNKTSKKVPCKAKELPWGCGAACRAPTAGQEDLEDKLEFSKHMDMSNPERNRTQILSSKRQQRKTDLG